MRTFPRSAAALVMLALSLSVTAPARADGPTAEQVGDPFSFGRSVTYLGRAVTRDAWLATECLDDPDCFTLRPQPQLSTFNVENRAMIELPADAAQSLVCFSITPLVRFEFDNLMDTMQSFATFRVNADVTVENEVLNDPLLIDPNTRMPYGGRMKFVFRLHDESRSLGADERAEQTISTSRTCVGGFASRVDLINAGLSEEQATQFFHKPIRLVFGFSGQAAMVTFGFLNYGVRVYGDR